MVIRTQKAVHSRPDEHNMHNRVTSTCLDCSMLRPTKAATQDYVGRPQKQPRPHTMTSTTTHTTTATQAAVLTSHRAAATCHHAPHEPQRPHPGQATGCKPSSMQVRSYERQRHTVLTQANTKANKHQPKPRAQAMRARKPQRQLAYTQVNANQLHSKPMQTTTKQANKSQSQRKHLPTKANAHLRKLTKAHSNAG
jgi:hypothetical protein